jgi:hypothetical protein
MAFSIVLYLHKNERSFWSVNYLALLMNTNFVPHSWFLEHWNSKKSLCNIQHRFSYLHDEWIEKICKKIFFHGGFFFKSTLSILRCTWTGRINLKIFLGYDINYLNIWPFMRHPRKASKLTFVCFQLAG